MPKLARMPPPAESPYGTDLYLWAEAQAALLRAGRRQEIDVANLAEEIASVGASQKSEIRSRLAVLIAHLLKWEYQPEKRKYGWRATLMEQRLQIEGLIEVSPSLKPWPEAVLGKAYRLARVRAADDTGLPDGAFPADCPYAIGQILDASYYPGAPEREVV
ncbi:DUF29 domain-containing protein [Methylobacterium trifolii]|uniref:DUF29 domain-containing protein n=1 Tax=Methylobacterium trifolii TaxID=1003092 RepID=A0ABQ4U027_9HYPH|nr:DUF29 domain-containing protein [Methylobacterium trifolii]GJE60497.1 hypothetical protein MPOCJGCO_2609 [Methylobacterium trifolii]